MSCPRHHADVQVLRTAGRTPGEAYPVGYPITWPRLVRLACSVGVGSPTGARTFSLTSSSRCAAGANDSPSELGGWARGIIRGEREGWLPVALLIFLISLPIASASTAPTDEVEGGGS